MALAAIPASSPAGREPLCKEFQEALENAGTKPKPAAAKDPQASAACEQLRQAVGSAARALPSASPPAGKEAAAQAAEDALAACAHAARCSYGRGLGVAPGALALSRSMLAGASLVASLLATSQRKQKLVDENLRRENARRRPHNYQVGDQVDMITEDPNKLDPRKHGPYPIVKVFTNGTVRILRTENTEETVNIRKLLPHKEKPEEQ